MSKRTANVPTYAPGLASAEEIPRRLTPTERLHEVTMAAMHRAPSPPEHSVTVSRNAKGVAQYEVTVRGYDVNEALQDALEVARAIDLEYPYPNGDGE